MIGCDCAVCRSPDPRDQRLRSSIYVETPECSWVVDTGTDFRTQALRESIRNVDAVIFPHSFITPLPVPHGDSIVNGYLFSRADQKLVAYLSDCSAVPDSIIDLIAGVKVLIIDALRDKPHPTHLSVDQALEIALRVQPDATYFTHICHELPQAAESRLPASTHIAYDGLRVEF